MTAAPSGPARPAVLRDMMRGALRPSVVTGLVAVVVATAVRGPLGATAAALGSAVALAFFSGGLWAMSKVVGTEPLVAMAAALAVYFAQIIVIGALILLLYGAPWLDGMVFAAAVLAVTLVWQVVAIRAYRRSRQPVYDGGHAD